MPSSLFCSVSPLSFRRWWQLTCFLIGSKRLYHSVNLLREIATRVLPIPGRRQTTKKVPGGKIPYSISMKDDSPFVFAGLWEGWKDPANDQWLHT
jgi:hypothetical protein